MECPRCHGEINRSLRLCPTCGYNIEALAGGQAERYDLGMPDDVDGVVIDGGLDYDPEGDEYEDDSDYDYELDDEYDGEYEEDSDYDYELDDEYGEEYEDEYEDDLDYDAEEEYDEDDLGDEYYDDGEYEYDGDEVDESIPRPAGDWGSEQDDDDSVKAPKRGLFVRIAQVFTRAGRKSTVQAVAGSHPWADASYEMTGEKPDTRAVEQESKSKAKAQPTPAEVQPIQVDKDAILDEWLDWEIDEPEPFDDLASSFDATTPDATTPPAEPRPELPVEPLRQQQEEARQGAPEADDVDATTLRAVPDNDAYDDGARELHGSEAGSDPDPEPIVLLDDDDPYVRASAYEAGGIRAIVRRWRTVLIVGVSMVAIVAAAIYSSQWNIEQVQRDKEEAAAAEEKRRADAPVEIVVTLDLGGYDSQTMTPAPVRIVGSTAKGPSVDEIVLLRPVRDALVMERGSYIVSLAGPVLSTEGDLYEGTVDSFALSITAEGATVNGQPVSIGAGSAMQFLYTKVDPQNITDSEIEAAQRWMLDAEVVNYQAYINAVVETRQQARNYLASEQARKEEEERKAVEDAAKKAEAQKKRIEQEKKKESSSSSSSDSSSSDSSSSSSGDSTSSTSDTTSSNHVTTESGTDTYGTDYNSYGYDNDWGEQI